MKIHEPLSRSGWMSAVSPSHDSSSCSIVTMTRFDHNR
jgi:hypothetical protein